MIFEIVTTSIMVGIALKAFVKKKGMVTNDSGKIQRIISLSGLNAKVGKDTLTTQLSTPWLPLLPSTRFRAARPAPPS
jgi:S-DNA-T family DNA segregation ATPase FtsK/SpoIIIE